MVRLGSNAQPPCLDRQVWESMRSIGRVRPLPTGMRWSSCLPQVRRWAARNCACREHRLLSGRRRWQQPSLSRRASIRGSFEPANKLAHRESDLSLQARTRAGRACAGVCSREFAGLSNWNRTFWRAWLRPLWIELWSSRRQYRTDLHWS